MKKQVENESYAYTLLKKIRSVEQRADQYIVAIARNIKRDVIDELTEKLEKIDDKLFDLENFTLDTNLNQGRSIMTKDEVEARFKSIIDLEYKRKIVALELEVKKLTYEKYFSKVRNIESELSALTDEKA